MLIMDAQEPTPGPNPAASPPPPGTDGLAGLACYNLYVGWRRAQAFYRGYFEEDVTPQRMYVMELLRPRGKKGLTVSELARGLVVELGSISGLIKRMEAEGLLTRERLETDRKTVRVTLTPSGRAACLRNERRLKAADERLYAQISKSEIQTLRRINAKLDALLNP